MILTFERKIYQELLAWKAEAHGEKALLIEGARRIGKSTIAEEFAKREYRSYLLIDFTIASNFVKNAFYNYLNDLDTFWMLIQSEYHAELFRRESLVIFDEIQKFPKAREAIKYLVKDGRYDFLETGSLISIHENVKDINIPSEEREIKMYPMDFEEFSLAVGERQLLNYIRLCFEKHMPLDEHMHRKAGLLFREYMLVGGMPQAVNTYLNTNNLSEVDQTKREILELYADDFRKIDPSGNISRLFMDIPSQLTGNASRYQVSGALGRVAEYVNASELLADLEDSLCVNFAYHANDPSVGLALHKDRDRYKMFVADTGLFITLAFWDKQVTENIIYQKLLSDKLSADLGYVYENVVAQMFKAAGNELYYYTWPTPSGKHNYEVDFLLSRGNKLCPIEVKSSGYKKHASLDEFCKKFSDKVSKRYLLYTKDLHTDGETTLVPVYMTSLL